MATKGNILQELWVNIRADISTLRAGFTAGKAEVKSFVGQMGLVSKQLKTMGKNITLVSGALVGLGALATSVFAKFEQSMANTQSVLGATTEELDTLTQFAREMGKTTVFTASQAADAMFFLAQAGFATDEVIASLEQTLNLATATQSNLADTTNIVVATLNQFNLAAGDAGRVANTFAAAISNSLANMEKLQESMKFVGPVAFQMGESIESTTAALSTLFDAGITASIAGTQLRQIFLRLVKPTKAANSALESLGIGAREVNPQFNSLSEILKRFEKAIPANKLRQASDELKDIFGLRAIAAFSVLLSKGSGELDALQEKITDTDKAAQQAATQIDTLKGAWRLLVSALQEAAIQLGTVLEPIIRGLTDAVRDFVLTFIAMPDLFKKITVIGPILAGALGLIVGPLFLLASAIPKIVAGFGAMKVALLAAGGPIGLITAGLIALAGAAIFFVGQERRRQEAIEKSLKLVREQVTSLTEERKHLKKLAEEFLKLDEKQKGSNELSARQKLIIDEINGVYPNLISQTDTYAGKLEDVKEAAGKATKEIETLTKAEVDLATAELTLSLIRLEDQLMALKKEAASDQGIFKDLLNSFRPVNFGLVGDEIKGVLNTLDILADSAGLKETEIKFGNIAAGSRLLRKNLEQAATEGGRFGDVVSDLSTIQTLLQVKQLEINRLKLIEFDQTKELSKEELSRLNNLKVEQDVLQKLSDVFAEAVGNTSEFTKVSEQIKNIGLQLQNLRNFGLKEPLLDNSFLLDEQEQEETLEELKLENIKLMRDGARVEEALARELAREEELEFQKQDEESLKEFSERRRRQVTEDAQHEIAEGKRVDRERQRAARATAAAVTQISEVMGTAIGNSALKIADSWKTALSDLVDIIAGVYKNILKATIALALATIPKNFAAAAKAAVGITLISAAQAVAKGLIAKAATGASIDRSGLLNVHAGETIVPASVTRSTRNDFRNKLLGVNSDSAADGGSFLEGSTEGSRGMTIEGDLVLVNPQVDEPKYWRKVIDNNLEEAELNHDKRFNRRS